MSPELTTFIFLKAQIDAISDDTNPLYQATVLKDEYEEIPSDKPKGMRIGKCVTFGMAPDPGQTEVRHYDVLLTIIFYVRIARGEKQARSSYREQSIAMAEKAAMLFFDDGTMGNQVENSRPVRLPRGMDDTDNNAYAVSNLVVVINETGSVDFTGKGTLL